MYIACEEMNFLWSMKEVHKVRRMWNEGYHIADIANEVERDIDELSFLLIDQIRCRRIKKRKLGYKGTKVIERKPVRWKKESEKNGVMYWLKGS